MTAMPMAYVDYDKGGSMWVLLSTLIIKMKHVVHYKELLITAR